MVGRREEQPSPICILSKAAWESLLGSEGSAWGGWGRGGQQTCEGKRFVTRSSPPQEPFGSPGQCLPEASLSKSIGNKQG